MTEYEEQLSKCKDAYDYVDALWEAERHALSPCERYDLTVTAVRLAQDAAYERASREAGAYAQIHRRAATKRKGKVHERMQYAAKVVNGFAHFIRTLKSDGGEG